MLAGLGLLAALAAVPVGAVAPPPPALLPAFAARSDSAKLTRIVTHRSTRFAERVRFETDAIVLAGPRRVALIESGIPPEKRDIRIPWTEVESVSLGRSRTAHGLLMGSLAGAATAGALVGAFGPDLSETGDHAVVYFAAAVGVGMALLGTLIGSGQHTWTGLYP